MPVLQLSDEQVMVLLEQLSEEQKKRLLAQMTVQSPRPRRRFGSAKDAILYMADDFDAPLDDFKEYM